MTARRDLRPEAAEAAGVFFLVLGGGAAILADAGTGRLGPLGVGLVFGVLVAVLVVALAPVSGAHFNPAITLAFAATGRFPWHRVGGYVAAQCVGAAAAALLLRGLWDDVSPVATRLAADVTPLQGAVVEALATALLAFVISAVATDARVPAGLAGPAIGATVAVGSLVAGGLTGASMNPARSLGPALAAGAWDHAWLYILAPAAGAVLGMACHGLLLPRRRPSPVARAAMRSVPAPLPTPRPAPAPAAEDA